MSSIDRYWIDKFVSLDDKDMSSLDAKLDLGIIGLLQEIKWKHMGFQVSCAIGKVH